MRMRIDVDKSFSTPVGYTAPEGGPLAKFLQADHSHLDITNNRAPLTTGRGGDYLYYRGDW